MASHLSSKLLALVQDMVNELDAALGDVAGGVLEQSLSMVPVGKTGDLKGGEFSHAGPEKGTWVIGYNVPYAATIHAGRRKGKKLQMHSGSDHFLKIALEQAIPGMQVFFAGRVQAVYPKSI